MKIKPIITCSDFARCPAGVTGKDGTRNHNEIVAHVIRKSADPADGAHIAWVTCENHMEIYVAVDYKIEMLY